MPWMLLSEPPRADATGNGAKAREGAVWILIGGLDRALLQAGIVGRLLEAESPPACIIASGFAVANAVLLTGARREMFSRRWEHLRASRFLVSAALGSVRLLGALNGTFDDLAALLAETAQSKTSRANAGPEVLVATEDGFTALPRDGSASAWRAVVKGSLRYASENPPLLAGAIREAAGRGSPVLVLGLERTAQSHPDVDAACRAAGAAGVRVAFVTAASPRKAGLFDYLLPGSGAPERLVYEGRSAAERWMMSAGRNGGSRTGQPPFGGVAAGGDEDFSGSERAGGLWVSDANDTSNWPK